MQPASAPVVGTRSSLALLLMLTSGFAALGYQIVWTQECTLLLGHESASVLAVVAAFFGGLSFGALALSPILERSSSPWRWYATCELVIAGWSVLLAMLLTPIADSLLTVIGPHPPPLWQWSVAFAGTFLLLLPATAAMGATMPAMERALSQVQSGRVSIAALYAANTAGAVLGVLVTALVLIPTQGLLATATVCALLNLACAAGAGLLFRGVRRERSTHTPPRGGSLFVLWATGALGIGYEALVVRVLSQVAENTVYTFAITLAVYLTGTTLGAAAHHRWQQTGDRARDRNRLLLLLAATCVIGTLTLPFASALKELAVNSLGRGMVAALLGEGLIALAAFLLPTLVMGALFSHLSCAARDDGVSLARALSVNTFGAALAPLVFGICLVPLIGSTWTLTAVVCGYIALIRQPPWSAITQAAIAIAAIQLTTAYAPLMAVNVPVDGRLVMYTEGILGTVSIVEDAGGVARLHINNRQQEGSSATSFADGRQGVLPLLLHPAPKHALFLGLGTGVTSSLAGATHPGLQLDVVELVPEVIDASRYFTHALHQDTRDRMRVFAADARRYVRSARQQYDVIVADNFHPARSGSGALYTTEHFRAIRERLAPAGVFCQWLPLHQMDLETLRLIVRSYLDVYPRGAAILATNSLDTPVVGLVARKDDRLFSIDSALLGSSGSLMEEFELPDSLAVLGTFIADSHGLAHFAAGAALNTDDHPLVTYRAPRATYAPESQPRDRLVALLHGLTASPEQLVSIDAMRAERLTAYWHARNRFIEVGRDVTPTHDVERMLAQVREPLLSVLRISPDFRPAYEPLRRMAEALSATRPDAARELMSELDAISRGASVGGDAGDDRVGYLLAPMTR